MSALRCADEGPVRPSRRAVAWAWDAILAHGQPVAGPGDLVRIPLSQSELAGIEGCSAGTIAWYLRCLGSAIPLRRGGIVIDRHLLSQLDEDHAPQATTARTASIGQDIIESFSRPSPDGSGLELVCNGRPPSLADLAQHLGLNRSSAHRHVASLERAGRLERRGRRLYVVPTPGLVLDSPPSAQPAHDGHETHQVRDQSREDPMYRSDPAAPSPVFHERTLSLLEGITGLLRDVTEMTKHLLDQASPDHDPRTTSAHNPRIVSAQNTSGHPLRAAPVAGSSFDVDLIDEIEPEVKSNQMTPRASDSREEPTARGPSSRGIGDWSDDELPGLLRPLLDECRGRGLPGVSDRDRVIRSLRSYSAEQVGGAALQMAADLRSGAPMKSPIAILIRKAEDRDPYYFPEVRTRPATPPPQITDDRDEIDEEALAAVASLGTSEMEQLDQAVAAHLYKLLGPGMAKAAMATSATLAYWRPVVWRQDAGGSSSEARQ